MQQALEGRRALAWKDRRSASRIANSIKSNHLARTPNLAVAAACNRSRDRGMLASTLNCSARSVDLHAESALSCCREVQAS
jgi:hypothetical protein